MKISFMGSKYIGFECLRILHEFCMAHKKYEICAVLTNGKGDQILDYCKRNKINLISSLDEYIKLDKIDLNISVQFNQILSLMHIEKAKLNVNLHMAPLPEYRGCNQFTKAILDEIDYFGTTIHILNEKVDSGDILYECRFKIREKIWVKELYDLTCKKSIELFKNNLENLLNRRFTKLSQSELIESRGTSFTLRKEIEYLKNLNLDDDKFSIEKTIRATHMKGFSPPSLYVDGKKFLIIEDNS